MSELTTLRSKEMDGITYIHFTDHNSKVLGLKDRIKELENMVEDKIGIVVDLECKVRELEALLKIAKCPCCDGSGAYYNGHDQICQCQFCDEKKTLLENV